MKDVNIKAMYTIPEVEIVDFEMEDIITTSLPDIGKDIDGGSIFDNQ